MGYMGFGMKKEAYTRKPKKPFKKRNEIYGTDLLSTKAKGQTCGHVDQNRVTRIKQFRQSPIFKVLATVFLLSISGYLTWDIWIHDLIIEGKIEEFEGKGIINYYRDNKTDFLLARKYIIEREDRLSEMKFGHLTNKYSITIKDKDLSRTVPVTEINHYYFNGAIFSDYSKAKIDEGRLVVENNLIDKNWTYSFINVKIEQIDRSILEYIDGSVAGLNKILATVKNKEFGIERSETETLINFNHPIYGTYKIVFTDKVLENSKLTVGNRDESS